MVDDQKILKNHVSLKETVDRKSFLDQISSSKTKTSTTFSVVLPKYSGSSVKNTEIKTNYARLPVTDTQMLAKWDRTKNMLNESKKLLLTLSAVRKNEIKMETGLTNDSKVKNKLRKRAINSYTTDLIKLTENISTSGKVNNSTMLFQLRDNFVASKNKNHSNEVNPDILMNHTSSQLDFHFTSELTSKVVPRLLSSILPLQTYNGFYKEDENLTDFSEALKTTKMPEIARLNSISVPVNDDLTFELAKVNQQKPHTTNDNLTTPLQRYAISSFK